MNRTFENTFIMLTAGMEAERQLRWHHVPCDRGPDTNHAFHEAAHALMVVLFSIRPALRCTCSNLTSWPILNKLR
jgi:hypothetical protein